MSTSYVLGQSLPGVWLSNCLEAEIKIQGINGLLWHVRLSQVLSWPPTDTLAQ